MNFHAGILLLCVAVVAAMNPKTTLTGDIHNAGSQPVHRRATARALRSLCGTDVAFEVSIQSDTSLTQNEVLKFDAVKLNIGGAYNQQSGIFTAPVTGTYLFWAHVMVNEDTYMSVFIRGQSKVLATGYCVNKHSVASTTTAALLNKGDQVWVTKDAGTAATAIRGNGYSNYGGTLLKQH
ncbi:complement C1q-like protein 2 [Haliotis cracherodii]|uniref:complement C1q-like protein 2 n=1 Tax=Haliotis cracherodii TaxID=6455 RepID=UPI0039EAEAB7